MSEKKAVFYCSASRDIDPKYSQAARECVRAACLAGYGIVSGGSFRGTMGAVCDTALELGAPNYGVMPEFMRGLEYQGLTELRWAPTMSIRKELMREGVCLAVALPGGIGTIDEWISTLAQLTISDDDNRGIIVANHEGMYDGTIRQLMDSSNSVFSRGKDLNRSIMVDDATQMIEQLTKLQNEYGKK